MTTVLNVDDNPANRYIRSRSLRSAGFEVIEAGTGQSALSLAHEKRPSLLLLDIKLPDMSGLDVCRELRRASWAQHMGIIHISATYVDIETESLNAGADIYLAEPVEQQELLSAARTLLRLRSTEDRLVASEERMRLAMEVADIATWELDTTTGSVVWSDHLYKLLDYPAFSVAPSLAAWLDRLAPADREEFRSLIDRTVAEGIPLVHEHIIRRADNGEERHLCVHGQLRRSRPTSPERLIGVAIDITQRKKIEAERVKLLKEAQAAQRAAEEAGRMKDEFLAILSHELRTPLTAMLGWIQLVRKGDLPAEQQTKAFETIERNVLLQIRLVNDLLDVSQIVAGKLTMNLRPVRLDEVLSHVIDSHRPAAAEKAIDLQTALEPGPTIVFGSEERLGQVFNNLLSNALKFTGQKGRIRISLQRDAASATLKIADNGEGIAPEALSRLFDRFWQADSSSRRRHGGLGLGLAIVRSIVEMHGGSVLAESNGRDAGSTFTVRLPLSTHEANGADSSASERRANSLAGLNILMVDDNADTLEMLAVMLMAEGAVVKYASTGDAACRIISTWLPDVLLLDLAMPGEDGYALLRRLCAITREQGNAIPPAIAVSGYAGDDIRQRAREAGFQSNLAKPFDMRELVDQIKSAVGLRSATEESR
jgi:PAS domain S-box-containing protein